MTKDKTVYLQCECSSKDHLVALHLMEWPKGEVSFYLSTQMEEGLSFWQRLKIAFKYLFKRGCNFGHWNETILTKAEARKIKELIDEYLYG